MPSLILRTTGRFLIVLLGMFSVFVLLRGHNEPGGGFIGGLLLAGSFVLYALGYDTTQTRRLLRLDPRTIAGAGLMLALLSGVAGMLVGDPFLTGMWLPVAIPGIGKIGTVTFFDVGVYFVVVGATLLILLTVMEE